MTEATQAYEPTLSGELADLSDAELHTYIHRLRDRIGGLQDYTTDLQWELTARQHREVLAAMSQP
ncbi:MAG: hypothetical protein NVS2B7_24330 [Herpetosiphon sp.]